jgi:hypothetical protein
MIAKAKVSQQRYNICKSCSEFRKITKTVKFVIVLWF